MIRLLLCLLLLLGSPAWADDENPKEMTDETVLSTEEEELLEILGLLQNFEMLDDIDVLAEMEEDQ